MIYNQKIVLRLLTVLFAVIVIYYVAIQRNAYVDSTKLEKRWTHTLSIFSGQKIGDTTIENVGVTCVVDSELIICGAPWHSRVYLYKYNDNTVSVNSSYTLPSKGYESFFGTPLVYSDKILAVGSIGECKKRGAVYLFDCSADTLSSITKLTAPLPIKYSQYGASVAMLDDTVVVGAPTEGKIGAAYVHKKINGDWQSRIRLQPSDGDNYARFGDSVAITEDYIFIGAPRSDNCGVVDSGAVYVFDRSNIRQVESYKIMADIKQKDSCFGDALAVLDDTLFVAAPAIAKTGAVYIFRKSDNNWLEVDTLSETADNNSRFGESIAAQGDTLIVGAPYYAEGDVNGAVYVYQRNDGAWSKIDMLSVKNKSVHHLGTDVQLCKDTIVIMSDSWESQSDSSMHIFCVATVTAEEAHRDVPE